MLAAEGAAFVRPGGRAIFRDIGFALAAGEIMCVLGPNGVGKTTLLRCLAGLAPLQAGTMRLDGRDLAGLSRRRIGQLIGLVPQSDAPAFSFTVRQMVEMGRAAHLGWLETPGGADRAIIGAALDRLGIAPLAERAYPELSGGERQLVLIARALVQQPRVLILDEPTAHLDFANAAQVLGLVQELALQGLGIVLTTHDPDQAFQIAAKVLLMRRGPSASFGPTAAVLTATNLSETFARPVRLVTVAGRTLCLT